jgi:hypothetical protein
MHLDEPQAVAARIVQAIEERSKDVYLGGPEGVFVRLNAWWPRLVDKLMAKQTVEARPFAEASASRRAAARVERAAAADPHESAAADESRAHLAEQEINGSQQSEAVPHTGDPVSCR